MGEFTITKWKCDRCKIVRDTRPDMTHGTGIRGSIACVPFDWSDICDVCAKEIATLFAKEPSHD